MITTNPSDWPKNGVVKGINGPAVGPASQITYLVRVNMPGAGIVDFDGVKPCCQRWPEEIDTVACPVDTPVGVKQYGTSVFFDIPELPKIIQCQ